MYMFSSWQRPEAWHSLELELQAIVSHLMWGLGAALILWESSKGYSPLRHLSSPIFSVLNDQSTIFFLKIPVYL